MNFKFKIPMILPLRKKKVSRGVQVCLAIGLIVLDFNAAACKTNHATLVSENEITL